MKTPQSVRVRADVKQPLTNLLTAKISVNLNSASTLHQRPQPSQRAQDPDPSTACLGQIPVKQHSPPSKSFITLCMTSQTSFIYNAIVYNIVIMSENRDVCEWISNNYSCVLLSSERGWHTQSGFAIPATVSKGWELRIQRFSGQWRLEVILCSV